MPDPDKSYDKPPIVEAVIEVRFSDDYSIRDLERCRDRLKKAYPKVEDIDEFEVEFAPGGEQKTKRTRIGFKLIAASGSDLVVCGLGTKTFGTSRMAPYTGWDNLIAKAKENFEIFTSVVGRPNVTRLAARFINRIDIPIGQFSEAPLDEFFNIGPVVTSGLTVNKSAFLQHIQGVSAPTGAKVTLQFGSAVPVLIDCSSVLLDIDASFDGDIPLKLDHMWTRVDELRQVKNLIFEQSITDRTRKLFQ